jgi:lipopolysaccharide transport system ATP-binding protein
MIQAEDVWKRFKIPHQRRSTILENIAGILSVLDEKRYSYEEFWALREVTFSLEDGESIGIVGPNGSGKSTLLKLMARTMKPDKGKITVRGRVAPILELGIGFQGDITVKENAEVYGIILGIPRSQIRERLSAIIEFAGLARFQDAKLKNLSSGMTVRLAFSIAIQSEADIFLVDEALAVGDIGFQEKCFDKFREFKKEGKSIVLVSHDTQTVNDFCEKGLYLLNGEVKALGNSEDVTQQYSQDIQALGAVAN